VQPRSVFADEPERVHYDGGSFHFAGLIALRNFYVPRSEAVGEGTVATDCAVSVGLLVDREVVLELGGYLEEYFILFEDLDLSYRLRSAGWKILSVEDAIIHHRGGTAGISFREGTHYPRSRVFFHSRNRWLFLARCYRLRTLLVAAPGLLAYELAWFGFALLGGNLVGWVKGKWAFLRLLPRVLRERRSIVARRKLTDRELLVPGPLTTTPDVARKKLQRALLGLLDGGLALWWRLVRGLAG
jgi:GT2 family glycosyltransferase